MKITILTFIVILSFLIGLGNCQFAKGLPKFLGNNIGDYVPKDYSKYWNQITLGWLSKWRHVQQVKDVYDWSFVDESYNYAKQNGLLYKQHTFIWHNSDPVWLEGMSKEQVLAQVQKWIRLFCQRYPALDFIDVVNQPLHMTPWYFEYMGGQGVTGQDWAFLPFKLARKYCPTAKLLVNDNRITAFEKSTLQYIQLAMALKKQGLIDGMGVQCHKLQGVNSNILKKNLFKMQQTELPVYISQLNLAAKDDIEQLHMYKNVFPTLYEHPAVGGVTLWGYYEPDVGKINTELIKLNGTLRPSMNWLIEQYFNSSVNKLPKAYYDFTVNKQKVIFNSTRAWDVDGNIVAWEWNFGNGQTSTDQNPTYTYAYTGQYKVELKVTDNKGGVDTFFDQIFIKQISTVDWNLPIAYGRQKFIGSIISNNYLQPNWKRYWNQVTPKNIGQWGLIEPSQNQMDWTYLDYAYNYARNNTILFKAHSLVDNNLVPTWLSTLTFADQAKQIEQWIKQYCQRYPQAKLIDVVNQPLHQVPIYANAIGGAGSSGWDWIIWAFQKARQYCPKSKLLINDHDILRNTSNTKNYIKIINLLQNNKLIDGIGCQGHRLQNTPTSNIIANLQLLKATNLPIYISSLDFNISNNEAQMSRMQQLIKLFYEDPSIKGITFWGYTPDDIEPSYAWLYTNNPVYVAPKCPTQILYTSDDVTLDWKQYTFNITTPGKVRARFINNGTLQVDYAIIDGVKYQAQDMYVNTGVSNGLTCGHPYNEYLHCLGYIQFPIGSINVTVRARGQDLGTQKLQIQVVTPCESNLTMIGLDNERIGLKWLKYQYLPNFPISTLPVADFNFIANGLTVIFDGTASKDLNGQIAAYSWNFGDLKSGSGDTTTHDFPDNGDYLVTLIVTDNDGNTAMITKTVSVMRPNVLPNANFIIVSNQNLQVKIDGSLSNDYDGFISTYSWDLGDNTIIQNQQIITHTYANQGTYQITLTIMDNRGGVSIKTLSVDCYFPNVLPIADFTWANNLLAVSFDASVSSDTDGTIVSYAWDFGNGDVGINKKFIYSYATAGNYTVSLTVTDNEGGKNTVRKIVEVLGVNTKPIPVFTVTYNNALRVELDGSSSTDPDGNITLYTWDFGDGNITNGQPKITHYYQTNNTYTIKLTVTDNRNGVSSTSLRVKVDLPNVPPVADFTYTPKQLQVLFDGSPSYDSDGIVATYDWVFGDGTSATNIKKLNHTFPAPGTYVVSLTVTDDKKADNYVQKYVTVKYNSAPVCSFDCTVYYQSVICYSTSTDDQGIISYDWSWGDTLISSGSVNANHDYAVAGKYTVKLTVKDILNARAICSKSILTTTKP